MMHRAGWRRKYGAAAVIAGTIVMTSGCPSRFDPRAEPLTATSSDPEARRAYHEARERLDAGEYREARARFHDFRAAHPEDPLAIGATLWEARAALGEGDAKAAIELAEPLSQRGAAGDPVAERAKFILGLSLARLGSAGEAQRARELLRPFVAMIASGEDQVELHAALAEASAQLGDVGDALVEYGLFYPGARAAERTYIRIRAGALVDKMDGKGALALYNAAPKDGLACALIGPKLAEERRAAGDANGAKVIGDEARAARRRFGLEAEAAGGGIDSAKAAIGLALPLSGRNRLTGERALRGALLAAEAIPASAGTLDLRVRDTESNPERAAQAVDELSREGVVAVVGSPDRAEAQAQAARAEALGLPLIELAPDDAARGGLVFKLIRPNPARAEALAARAVSLGMGRVATLYPDNPYGKKMAEAFAERARAKGAKVVLEIGYDEKTTTFIGPAKQLLAAHPDAVFVPAPASQLELVAAQLAATGVTRTQGAKAKGGAILLATADGLTAKLMQSAGRYVQGAVFAPVFYADAADARLGPFVEKFRGAYGEEPGAADALGFDAVGAVRSALGRTDPAEGRAGLARRVANGGEAGVTGTMAFGPAGERGGEPQLYLVDGEAIRALR